MYFDREVSIFFKVIFFFVFRGDGGYGGRGGDSGRVVVYVLVCRVVDLGICGFDGGC